MLDGIDGPRLDTPPWLWTSWGPLARAIAEAHQLEAGIDLTWPGEPPELAEAARLPTGSLRLPPGTRITEVPGYAEGAFWVQDAAAALPARLLDARPGELVADLCAAPGGKAAQLAATGATVFAIERDPGRIVRLRENLERLRLSAEIIAADAAEWQPPALLDAVLLDAPCSFHRHHSASPGCASPEASRDIAALCAQQDRLLDAACRMLKPGGRLVYAVCSLQPEEGPERLAACLSRLPLILDPIALPSLPSAVIEGCLRTHPALTPSMDGFFAARLFRSNE